MSLSQSSLAFGYTRDFSTSYLSDYYGNMQLADSTTPAATLTVTTTSASGMSSGGAYSPAGNPIRRRC